MRFLRDDDDDDDEGLLFGDFLGPFVSNDDDDKGGDVDVGASCFCFGDTLLAPAAF